MPKITILDIYKKKADGKKITMLTAYDYPTAQILDQAGIDMILVGDSLGMVVQGVSSTLPVTMDDMIYHTRMVSRAAQSAMVVGDMPFLSYQVNCDEAVRNAGRFFKEARVDAIKLEGGRRVCPQIRSIADGGMLVMGHIGLTPQSSGQLGGFKAQGRTAETALELIEDAKAIQTAGAYSLLVEAVPPEVCKIIRGELTIPVYSIGAGIDADGQLMIVSDILGIFQAFTPKFVKKYANLGGDTLKALSNYAEDVRAGRFPETQHTYNMMDGELPKLKNALKKLKR